MNENKILIIGSSSKLGEALAYTISSETDFQLVMLSSRIGFKLSIPSATYYKCNVLDFKKVKEICNNEKPYYIVNCASVNDILYSEKNRKICSDVNTMAYDNILSICRVLDSILIMPSCDFIFNGIYGPYSEDKHPDPVNYIGKTKHAAENNCRAGTINLSIVRTSLLYGMATYQNSGFINDIIETLSNGKKVHLPDNHLFTPTFAEDAARAILRIIEKERKEIYHAASHDMLSLYQIALTVAEVFSFDKNLIVKIPSDKYELKNFMPDKAGLVSLKSETDLSVKFSSLMEGLSVMKYKMKKKDINTNKEFL
jgi:dTDP-4-dehydrorhamnose reductase